jgi:hypothetical protein
VGVKEWVPPGVDQEREPPLYTFPKNTRQEVRCCISRFGGNTFADFRVFARASGGVWIPTRKGLALSPARLSDLAAAVAALQAAFAQRGEDNGSGSPATSPTPEGDA